MEITTMIIELGKISTETKDKQQPLSEPSNGLTFV
jgi:hypothetical protein